MGTKPERPWPLALIGIAVHVLAGLLGFAFWSLLWLATSTPGTGNDPAMVSYVFLALIVLWVLAVVAVIVATVQGYPGDIVAVAIPFGWISVAVLSTIIVLNQLSDADSTEEAAREAADDRGPTVRLVDADDVDDDEPPVATESVVVDPRPEAVVGLAGQTVVIDDVAVRLIDVEFTDTAPGLPPAGAGRVIVLVEIELANRGDETLAYDEARLRLSQELSSDHVGAVASERVGVKMEVPGERALGSGSLEAGGRMRGLGAFNIPAETGELYLEYSDEGASSHRWRLSPPVPSADVVPPARCRLPAREPITSATLATPPGVSVSDMDPRIGLTLPDPALQAWSVALIEQVVACVNAGDRMRLAALLTDDFLRRYPGVVESLAEATPGGDVTKREMRVLATGDVEEAVVANAEADEGWMQVTVVLEDPDLPGERVTTVLALRQVGDRWLIDDVELSSESNGAWLFAALAGEG